MSNFINIHVLISHSPSCLNRDDMNMQKDAIFGGKRRVRISSQSLKRAMRKSDYYAQNIGESSLRTIHLAQLRDVLRQKLSERFDQKIIDKTLALLSGKSVDEAEKISADAVTPWVVGEIAWFCEQVAKAEADNLDDKKLLKVLKEDIAAIRVNLQQGVDIALSGRMATSGMMSELGKVDGAMSIAHAITTHQVDSDIDWFTAVDDLQEQGSAHLGTQEFSSGVFYRYANINLAQLQENLGGASREQALEKIISGRDMEGLEFLTESFLQRADSETNAGIDGGTDARVDTETDAGADTETDADAGADTGAEAERALGRAVSLAASRDFPEGVSFLMDALHRRSLRQTKAAEEREAEEREKEEKKAGAVPERKGRFEL